MKLRDDRAALASWALVLMLFDHVAFIVEPHVVPWLGLLLRVPGRFSMPAFAYLTASACRSLDADRLAAYVRRLGLLAVVSEGPYWLLFHEHVNAVAALWLGAWVCWEFRSGYVGVALAGLVVGGLGFAMLGAPGEAFYAVLVVFTAIGGGAGLVGASGAALLLNWPSAFFGVAQLGAWALVRWGSLPALPEFGKRFRYAFYPVHLLVLAGLSLGVALG